MASLLSLDSYYINIMWTIVYFNIILEINLSNKKFG